MACVYKDCRYSKLEEKDILEQNLQDKEIKYERLSEEAKKIYKNQKRYFQSEKGKEALKRYNCSEKGKERQKKYSQSDKGKEAQKRYEQSEKGKEKYKRQTQKKIANGKNAEYCRAYYQRKKEKLILEQLRLLQIEGSVCL